MATMAAVRERHGGQNARRSGKRTQLLHHRILRLRPLTVASPLGLPYTLLSRAASTARSVRVAHFRLRERYGETDYPQRATPRRRVL